MDFSTGGWLIMSQPNGFLILGDHLFLNYKKKLGRGGWLIPRGLLILTWHYSFRLICHIWPEGGDDHIIIHELGIPFLANQYFNSMLSKSINIFRLLMIFPLYPSEYRAYPVISSIVFPFHNYDWYTFHDIPMISIDIHISMYSHDIPIVDDTPSTYPTGWGPQDS